MADSILRKADPFVLDETVAHLEKLATAPSYPLPLGTDIGANTNDEDRSFLETPFNRLDNGEYRNPWKATTTAATVGGSSSGGGETEIREFESTANEVWDAYRQLYYGHDAVGSVFVRRKGAEATASSKSKKGGALRLECLFGIHKTCSGDDGSNEIARWDSVHTVTIEAPNFEENTCDYHIQSAVWCRYRPEDVGDVPKADRPEPPKPKPSRPRAKKPPTKKTSLKLDLARLEVFDKAAKQWGGPHNGTKQPPEADTTTPKAPPSKPGVPIPAVVTSAAVYTKDTTKVCKLTTTPAAHKKKQTSSSSGSGSGIPIASHIQNIGTLLEKIETDVRSKFERVDAPRCVEVLQGMYRPSLSPGLKLGGSMVTKLGGHATGMGVGKSLIGEIALKAKSKGLGTDSSSSSSSNNNNNNNTCETTKTNKAMEGILANEKKKLKDPPRTVPKRPNLRKAASVRTFGSSTSSSSSSSSPTPDFLKFKNKLKSTKTNSPKAEQQLPPSSPTKSSPKGDITSTSTSNVTTTTAAAAADVAAAADNKTKTVSPTAAAKPNPYGRGMLKRPNLRKAVSVRTFDSSTPTPTPEFMNFRSKLKSTAAK